MAKRKFIPSLPTSHPSGVRRAGRP
jgi:hypothetical protein